MPTPTEEEMHALMSAFWHNGYVLIGNVLDEHVVRAFADAVEALVYVPSPLPRSLVCVDPRTAASDDAYRARSAFSAHQVFQDIRQQLEQLAVACMEDWDTTQFAVVKTVPHPDPRAREQLPHQEFDINVATPPLVQRKRVPAGLIASLMGVSVTVYKQCYCLLEPRRRAFVSIPPGAVLLYRADLIHHDRAYAKTHYYAHGMLTYSVDGPVQYAPVQVATNLDWCTICKKPAPLGHAHPKTRGQSTSKEHRRHQYAQRKTCSVCHVEFENAHKFNKHRKASPTCMSEKQRSRKRPAVEESDESD